MFGSASAETPCRYAADRRIAQRQLSLAEIVIERAAFYEAKLKEDDTDTRDHGSLLNQLSQEYITVRIALVSLLVAPAGMQLQDKCS